MLQFEHYRGIPFCPKSFYFTTPASVLLSAVWIKINS